MTTPQPVHEYDAIVLAGGLATRLGGVDKTGLDVGGTPILERVTGGLADARAVVVVGPEVRGGPVLALAAGVARTQAPIVVTVAGDQPFVAGAVPHLLTALAGTALALSAWAAPGEGHDVAVLVADGHTQYLAAAWRRPALLAALARFDELAGLPVRLLFDGADAVAVPDTGGWSRDVDTAADLAEVRRLVARDAEA